MKIKYDRDVDILMIELSDEKIDYAEETGPMIIHFFLDASEFLAELTKISTRADKEAVEIKT